MSALLYINHLLGTIVMYEVAPMKHYNPFNPGKTIKIMKGTMRDQFKPVQKVQLEGCTGSPGRGLQDYGVRHLRSIQLNLSTCMAEILLELTRDSTCAPGAAWL